MEKDRMKFTKLLTRKYKPIEHSLILGALIRGSVDIAGVYYTEVVDVSRDGLIDVFVAADDPARNSERVRSNIERDENYLENILKSGYEVIDHLARFPIKTEKEIAELSTVEIIAELEMIRDAIFSFGGFIEVAHYIEELNLDLDAKTIERLAKYHDVRKQTFMAYFDYLGEITQHIKSRFDLTADPGYLTLPELLDFLAEKMSKNEVEDLCSRRQKLYIARYRESGVKIYDKNPEDEIIEFEKSIVSSEDENRIVAGLAVNKGKVTGRVKIIHKLDDLKEDVDGMVIVTHMTTPAMVPYLGKIAALITDEGGLLCHAAYVARELGKIAIVGTKNAAKILKDGDMVEVDADKGIAKKIK